ncbi:hypothetical protein GC098_07730 [Paenibacillus sp. LMG 31458]|uniref:Zorya protein ZorC EH domain-containing protein n=1 Tax=Paenibacillus phytorum TaxID=2654977 RepID=A0ABX1XSD2_9BACL|nr:hypothetical protein [Paenibacillus phytorum]NOU71309.1 hypothetical protein [Paenibacillus phytorum]
MDEKESRLIQWKYWAQCSIKILDEYSPYIKLSNENYISNSNHALILSNPKGFYLFGVLDEISKIGTSMFRWIEFISGEEIIDPKSYPARSVIQAVFDEQQMWGRKLLEAIVDLILFKRTNEESYYKHYLLLKELWDSIDSYKDWKEFFDKSSNKLDFQKKLLVQTISNHESSIELNNCWYLNKRENILRTSDSKSNKKSFRQKLIKALPDTNSREKLIIGLTYKGYSEFSESIHFNPDRNKWFPNKEQIELNMSRIWLTILCIIDRLQKLTGIQPKGFNNEMNELLSHPTNIDELLCQLTGDFFQKSDIVILDNNELCIIEDVSTSKYGYKMYKLAYLQRKERPEFYDEWLPGNMMHLIYKLSDHKKAQDKNPVVNEFLKDISDEDYITHYANYFVRKWEQGMKDYFLKRDKAALIKAFKQ